MAEWANSITLAISNITMENVLFTMRKISAQKFSFFAHYRQNLSRCQQRGDNSGLRKKRYESIFSPTMEMMSVVMKNSRQKVAGSWKTKMPNRTVPTAPMPVHTG